MHQIPMVRQANALADPRMTQTPVSKNGKPMAPGPIRALRTLLRYREQSGEVEPEDACHRQARRETSNVSQEPLNLHKKGQGLTEPDNVKVESRCIDQCCRLFVPSNDYTVARARVDPAHCSVAHVSPAPPCLR